MRECELMDKQDKKAVKAAAKIAKKQAGTREVPAPGAAVTSGGLTAAERSAQAAERQVILQQRRVWLALLSLVLGAVAVVASLYGVGYFRSAAGSAAASQPAMTSPAGG